MLSGKNLLLIGALFLQLAAFAARSTADDAIAVPICQILKKMAPEIQGYVPEAAQAQLVIAIGDAFDFESEKLHKVSAEIDKETEAACPKEREAVLAVLKMKSLASAIR